MIPRVRRHNGFAFDRYAAVAIEDKQFSRVWIIFVIAANAHLIAGRTVGTLGAARKKIGRHGPRVVLEIIAKPKRDGVRIDIFFELPLEPAPAKSAGVVGGKFNVLFHREPLRCGLEIQVQLRFQSINRRVIILGKFRYAGGGRQCGVRPRVLARHCFKLMQRSGRCGEFFVGGFAPEGFGAGEDSGQRVVIARGDGVVFVIVAARARHAEAHHRGAHHVDLVRHHVHIEILIHRLGRLGSDGEKSGGHEVAVALGFALGRQ